MIQKEGSILPMGAWIHDEKVNFSIAVPKGKKCELRLYLKGSENPSHTFQLDEKNAIGEVRAIEVSEFDYDKYEYDYLIDDSFVMDPYAKEISAVREFGQPLEDYKKLTRAYISNAKYDWEGDSPLNLPYYDVIAYSIHVRGFTKHRTSKVKRKGTFAGVIEKIPYFKELGINQIQCMPIYEFEDLNKKYTNYWGYGKALYFAPKKSYAYGKSSVTELKDMVKELHKAGIEVILYFPFTEGVRAEMVENCLEYYLTEFHVDGFILNPYNAPMQSIKSNPLFADTKVMIKDDRFQNTMRRFLKGDEGMIDDVISVLRHNTSENDAFNYITDHTGFTLLDLVSYDGKHNEKNGEKNQDGTDYNYSWNCGEEGPSRKKMVTVLRKNQIRNAFFLLLSAQGMPVLLAGDEFGNSQDGNNNPYCQDNETTWLNWSKCKDDSELLIYVKDLIALRKKYRILHQESRLSGMDKTSCGIPDVSYHGKNAWRVPSEISSRQIGILYSGNSEEHPCFVAYNMYWLDYTFALPTLSAKKKWYQVMDTKEGVFIKERLIKDQKSIQVKARTVTFLVGR